VRDQEIVVVCEEKNMSVDVLL